MFFFGCFLWPRPLPSTAPRTFHRQLQCRYVLTDTSSARLTEYCACSHQLEVSHTHTLTVDFQEPVFGSGRVPRSLTGPQKSTSEPTPTAGVQLKAILTLRFLPVIRRSVQGDSLYLGEDGLEDVEVHCSAGSDVGRPVERCRPFLTAVVLTCGACNQLLEHFSPFFFWRNRTK